MSQVQVSRPANKLASKSSRKTLWAIHQDHRPTRGAALLGHMMAAVTVLGMFSGRASKDTVEAFLGSSAVSYHRTRKTFDLDAGTLGLTPTGKAMFEHRLARGATDQGTVDAYIEVMTRGPKAKADWITPDQMVEVRV